MTDIVVGAIVNYSWDHIKCWVNSLISSGFEGRKILVCYNIDDNTIRKLEGHGVQVCLVDHAPDNICVDRFFWYWQMLNLPNLVGPNDIVVATDVRDVVFQSDPVKWIKTNTYTPKIIASSEGIRYCDEVWGQNNFKASFPESWSVVENRVILNAGVIAGQARYIKDLFLNIYWTSRGARYQHVPGGGGPDQAAYNMLMANRAYYELTRLASMDTDWAAQLGTTGPQINYGSKGLLTHPQPKFVDEQVVTHSGKPYTIVHQYDRVPGWSKAIEEKYS